MVTGKRPGPSHTSTIKTQGSREELIEQEQQRQRLLKLIRPYVGDFVYQAFETVDRKSFTPSRAMQDAYSDVVIPLEQEGSTMSEPTLVAEMIELMGLKGKREENVLEVGTGSGYSAAILAKCAAHVTTIEINPQLAEQAKTRLSRLGFKNVSVQTGDGRLGFPQKAPFDAIVVTAAAKEVPKALVEQLVDGGRIIVPIGSETSQVLKHITKLEGNVTEEEDSLSVRFVPLVDSTQPFSNPA